MSPFILHSAEEPRFSTRFLCMYARQAVYLNRCKGSMWDYMTTSTNLILVLWGWQEKKVHKFFRIVLPIIQGKRQSCRAVRVPSILLACRFWMTTAQLTLTFEVGIQILTNVRHLPCGLSLSIEMHSARHFDKLLTHTTVSLISIKADAFHDHHCIISLLRTAFISYLWTKRVWYCTTDQIQENLLMLTNTFLGT